MKANARKSFIVKDGYYLDEDGNRLGKELSAFRSCRGSEFYNRRTWLFWEPCLSNIERIEKLYHRLSSRREKFQAERKLLLQEIKVLSKGATYTKPFCLYAIPTHKHEPTENQAWQYNFFFDRTAFSWTHDWIKREPGNKYRTMGQRFYHLDLYANHCLYLRHSYIAEFLLTAIVQDIEKTHEEVLDKLFHYTINGREYYVRWETIRPGHEVPNFVRHIETVQKTIGVPDWMKRAVGKVLSLEELQRIYKDSQ